MFITYPKIKRLGDEETEGILIGTVHVEEKIDGANTSIWKEADGSIHCGSRTQDVTEKGFNGFAEYVKNHEGIQKCLAEHPEYRLYGEWLVRHTIAYNETVYRQFYLYDIFIQDSTIPEDEIVTPSGQRGTFLDRDVVTAVGTTYGINMPTLFATLENPTNEQVNEHVGKSVLGPKGEGVVLKNLAFRNKFGDLRYAKLVTQEFKEDNGITFGGNNKNSDAYNEMYCVQKYMTLERIQKVMNKLQPLVDKKLGMEHTSRIIETAYHDMFTEEIWTISKKFDLINFRKLGLLATRKAAKIYHDLLAGHISIVYGTEESNAHNV